MNIRLIPGLVLGLATTLSASAALITEPTRTFAVTPPAGNIPDVQNPGMVFQQTVLDSLILQLTDVVVGLHLVGQSEGTGWASEIHVLLNRDLGPNSATLLNRVGFSTADTELGQGYDGWDVTFDDAAINGDVHLAELSQGVLTGTWAPDGRDQAVDVARPYTLAVFDGLTGNGDWYLSVADLVSGGSMQLVSWSLTLTGHDSIEETPAPSPVPETSTWLAGAGLAAAGLARRWRVRNRQ